MHDPSVMRGAGVAFVPPPRFRRRSEAAEYISDKYFPCRPKTLAKLAVIGGGPKFRKAGRFPIYEDSNLDEWALGKISELVGSTSELRGVA
jgi:hypothetical protein